MKSVRILAAALALAGGAAAAGTADVRFIDLEKFTDMSDDSVEQSDAIRAIQGHLQALARRLPPDAVLHVDILDVDLAGSRRMNATGTPVRVLRGKADFPKISLRWVLEERGQNMGSGEDKLNDMTYLDREYANPGRVGNFYYEKRMLDLWFDDNFAPRAQRRRR